MTTPSPEAVQKYLADVRNVVAEHGWMVQCVMGDDHNLPFAYTVGLSTVRQPELITFGLAADDAEAVLDRAAGCLPPGGGWSHGRVCEGLLQDDYLLMTLQVTDSREHLTLANLLYGAGDRPLPAWQVVLQDVDHRWPWDAGAMHADMPVLGPIPTQ